MQNRSVRFRGEHLSWMSFSASCRKVSLSRKMPKSARWKRALPFAILLAPVISLAQEVTPTGSPNEAEVESVVVSATRFDIPLDQSPATVTVISSEDIEQKQIQRVSDAL